MPFRNQLHPANLHTMKRTELSRAVALSIPNDTDTLIDFDTISADDEDFFDIAAPTDVVLPNTKPGYFYVSIFAEFDVNAAGYRQIDIRSAGGNLGRLRVGASPTLSTVLMLGGFVRVSQFTTRTLGIRVRHTAGVAILCISPQFQVWRLARL